jgi:pyrroline-5-carboxylate reductase
MEKIGFIGYGAMGSMIIMDILQSKVLEESQMVITTRSLSKLEDLKKTYPKLEIAPNNIAVAKKTEKIFIFVNTGMVKGVMDEIKGHVSPDTHIIYIAAGLTIENLQKVFTGKISKVIPSLTSEVNEGISLIAHNQQVSDDDAEFVEEIFQTFSTVKTVREDQFGLGADLTSCAPAFISIIMMKFAETATKDNLFTREEAEEMVIETLYGTAKLLHQGKYTFEEIMGQVATRGGITEEGLKILNSELPSLFEKLFKSTLKKYELVESDLNEKYNS